MREVKDKTNTSNKGVIANSFKAFESIVAQGKMFVNMTIWILIILFIGQILLITGLFFVHNKTILHGMSNKDICIIKTNTTIFFRDKIAFGRDYQVKYICDGEHITVSRHEFKATFGTYIKERLMPKALKNIILIFVITSPIYLLFFTAVKKLHKKHIDMTADKFIRGKKFIPQEYMPIVITKRKQGERGDKSYHFKLNEYVEVPESLVTRHNFVIGKPGSGKSQFIFKIVRQLIERDIKCVIHDFKGDFIPAFYNEEKHLIFNPVDRRHMGLNFSINGNPHPDKKFEIVNKPNFIDIETQEKHTGITHGWTIFNELKSMMDLDAFVNSVIPAGANTDSFWFTAPRDILKAMLIYCIKHDKTTNNELCEMLRYGSDRLKECFSVIEDCACGAQHLEDGKLAGQLLSVLSTNTACLSYLKKTDGNFSITKWVQDPNPDKKIIFVSNQAMVQDTLKPLISTFFDFATKSLCSLKDDMDRRLYFILDEFGQLSKIGSVVQLLTQARSKGGAAFLLIQDQAQIEAIYGGELVKSIVNSCGNKFYFAVGDETTAEFISKELGSIEIERNKESKSFGVTDMRDTISQNVDVVEKRIALASEIMTLQTMRCYMQITDIPLTLLDLAYDKPDYNHEGFVGRDSDFVIKKTEKDHELEEQKQREKDEIEANIAKEEILINQINMVNSEMTLAEIFAEVDDESDGEADDIVFDFDRLHDEQSDTDNGRDDIIDVREVTEGDEEPIAEVESNTSATDPDDFVGKGDEADVVNYNFDKLY